MRLQAQHLKPGNVLSKGTSEVYSSLVIMLLHIPLIVTDESKLQNVFVLLSA